MIQQLGWGETATGEGEAKSPAKATLEDSGGSDQNFLHICLFTQAGKTPEAPFLIYKSLNHEARLLTCRIESWEAQCDLLSFTEVDWWIAGGFHI